jgi:pyruvate dehydrogenase E2 component (dihydrolipoyllysine-residue acetyltransferase)
MPDLGEEITAGTVTRWLKRTGDRVAAGEPLVEVSTDKVDTEVRPAPAANRRRSESQRDGPPRSGPPSQ